MSKLPDVVESRLQAEIDHLRQRIDDRNQHDRELISTTYSADQKAAEQTTAEITRRLGQMTEWKGEVEKEVDLKLRILSDNFRSELAKNEAATRTLDKTLADKGKPNWSLMIGLLSVIVVIVSGAYFLISQQIIVANAPIALAAEQLKLAVAGQANGMSALEVRLRDNERAEASGLATDAESRTDRARLNGRVQTLENNAAQGTAERKASMARFAASLVEIETQFCAAGNVMNLRHANDLRVIAMLWHRVSPNEVYPTDNAFYPIICNRGSISHDIDPMQR